jgi:hypothetical protein
MEDLVSKRVFIFLNLKPSKEIYEICITLKDVHDVLAETTRVISDAHVNVWDSVLFDVVQAKQRI